MDAVSYSHADKQKQRIEKINANPDSDSGIVTVPKVIGAGESVTVPAGRVAVLPNIQVDGEIVVEGEVFVPAGSSVDFSTGIKVNGEKLTMSIPTAYHIYNGSVEATNTVVTNGFSTTLYTGNGTTQDVVTGVDMATQWGDDASEQFGGLVWFKERTGLNNNVLTDTVRGGGYRISSNSTDPFIDYSTDRITSFNSNGISLGNAAAYNTNLSAYVSWNFQTTHRISGVTNHGKPYTCHYNPYTGFTIVKYEGSGIAGHEIPHHLGRKLGFVTVKNLSNASNWIVNYKSETEVMLNSTGAEAITANTVLTDAYTIINRIGADGNTKTNQFILYGWANSYLDEDNTLIGNYEIGVYQGTGVAGNKVKTRGKPAWVMIKRLDGDSSWFIYDNQRVSNFNDGQILAETSNSETTADVLSFISEGIEFSAGASVVNAAGSQFLYMVVYDNDSGSGKSKYPKATDTTNLSINALVPYSNGIDVNGSKVSIEYKNETITGLTLTEGKNYPYSKSDGTYGVNTIAPSYGTENPLTGDFFNLKTLKWYDNTNIEITPRTYLDCVVYADHNGQVSYVEELQKIEYKDVIKANEYQGKNACTAWVNFNGATTPPTIRDSYNVKSVIRTSAGRYNIYFEESMDNTNYTSVTDFLRVGTWVHSGSHTGVETINSCYVGCVENNVHVNSTYIRLQIFGGKN